MRFIYKAKNNKGAVVTGTVKATTQFDAEKILIHHGLVPMELISEQKKRFSLPFGHRVTMQDKAVFARLLATMISSGLPLIKAITIVAAQARNDYLKSTYGSIYKDLEEGYSFSRSLAKYPDVFDRIFVSVINSGENTGKLDVVLVQLADQLERENTFMSKVRGALYYPALILIAMVGVGTYMLVAIIPQLTKIFEESGAKLPLATQLLISLSHFVIGYWWLIIVLLVAGVLLLRIWLLSDAGTRSLNLLQIEMPGIKQVTEGVYVGRFARTMAMLVGAGVPLLDSLRTSASMMNNEIYEDNIMSITTRVEKGVSLSSELVKSSVFPQLVGQMVSVGEETGQLDKVLGKVADYFEGETATRMQTLSTLIEPVVLAIIGAGVAFLVFAILLPIYNLAQIQ